MQDKLEKLNGFVKVAAQMSDQYARTYTGMDTRTLLKRHGKYIYGGLAVLGIMFFAALCGSSSTAASGSGGGQVDEQIVGNWRHTWAQSDPISGMSMAIDDRLILNADGTCQFGSSNAAVGDASTSFVAGPTELSSGYWRAEAKTLYIHDGDGQWRRVGTYMCNGTHLLITAGEKTIFERI